MESKHHLLDGQALALLAHRDDKGNQSLIVTLQGSFLSKLTPTQLLNIACLDNGATKKDRKQEAYSLLQYKHKSPFVICDGVGAFPTSSSNHESCAWIFNHFFTMTIIDKRTTLLNFASGITVTVPVSQHVLRQQNGRLHTLLSHYTQERKNLAYEERHLFDTRRLL